ncbi:hypothetical protein ACIA8O_27365 [Kitasatospora sp. NPDC051853]|uniref:hypothetical protein n=1 Tax=Kitasatospora sp. NPDC051853 TaxID=3364058 RepID=UPI0037BB6FAA
MPQIEIDVQTARALEFAARIAGVTPGQVIARLVEQASLLPASPDSKTDDNRVAVHANYDGHRTNALFDPATHRVDIVSGPLENKSFKSPTGAASAVVHHYNPTVSTARNGWSFWFLSDNTGRMLQTIRHQANG